MGIKSISDEVFELLRSRIIEYELKPGQYINEREVAEELNVSRTPIREALRRLAEQGFVSIETNKGAKIISLSLDDFTEIYQIRIALEGYSGRLATPRIDSKGIKALREKNERLSEFSREGKFREFGLANTEWHLTIYSYANNERIFESVKRYWELAARVRTLVFWVPGRTETVVKEHGIIIDNLEARDACKVELCIREHLEEAQQVFIQSVQNKHIVL